MLNQDQMLKELVKVEKDSVIDPSISEWASPMALVKKKDGNLRMCVDYHRLNSVSWADAYPMPHIDELIDRLGKAQYISTMICHVGIGKSQWEQLLQDKTTFVTPQGLVQFQVMPFGLHGAPATFQWLMDWVINGLLSQQPTWTILL